MFNRRVTETGPEAESDRRAPVENAAVQVAERAGKPDTDRDGKKQKALPGDEPLPATFGAVATWIDRDRCSCHPARGCVAPLALGDQSRGGHRVRHFTTGATECVGAEPLGPGVERRVSGSAFAADL